MSSVTARTGRMTAHIVWGWLFQTCGPAATKVLFPKLLRVQLTTRVRVSAEHSCLTRASATSWQSSARQLGALPDKDLRALPDKDQWTRVAILNYIINYNLHGYTTTNTETTFNISHLIKLPQQPIRSYYSTQQLFILCKLAIHDRKIRGSLFSKIL